MPGRIGGLFSQHLLDKTILSGLRTRAFRMAVNRFFGNYILSFATDARIDAFELINLEDDLNFFPSYNAAVALTKETYEEYPEIEELLQPLAEVLNDESLREINYLVDIEDKSVREVAENFLEEHGLLE